MDIYDKFSRSNDRHRQMKEQNAAIAGRISKDKLSQTVSTKMRTTFIGALDSIEKKVGFLWGYAKACESLTESERSYAKLWEELRNEILNKGNNQLRSLLLELGNYEVQYVKRNYEFPILKERNEDG